MLMFVGDSGLALFLPQFHSSLLKGTNKLEPDQTITFWIKDLLYPVPCAENQSIRS